jgi:hypothetical protein
MEFLSNLGKCIRLLRRLRGQMDTDEFLLTYGNLFFGETKVCRLAIY